MSDADGTRPPVGGARGSSDDSPGDAAGRPDPPADPITPWPADEREKHGPRTGSVPDGPQDRLPETPQWTPKSDIPEAEPWRPRTIPTAETTPASAIDENTPKARPANPLRSSKAVKIGLTAAVAGVGLWIFWPQDEPTTHAGVCVDKDTNTRLPDQECDGSPHHSHVGWYFFAYGMSAPRVGAPVSGGSFDTPRGTSYVTGGVDSRGGTVSSSTVHGGKTTTVRGGFGGSGKSSGG